MLKILTRLLQPSIWTNFLVNITSIFSFLAIIYFVYLFAKYNVVRLDDIYEVFPSKDLSWFSQYFVNVYHGRYVGNFLTKFVGSIIPELFNIHINVWIQTGGAIIKGIFLSIICFMLSNFFFIFRKKNILYPIIAFFVYLFYQYNFLGTYQDTLYASFFGFTFPFIFFYLYWQNAIKLTIIEGKVNRKVFYFLAFLLGCSTEFTSIVSFFSLAIFCIFAKKLLAEKQKIVLKSFYWLILGMFLYYLNPGFIASAKFKGIIFSLEYFISRTKEIFIEFINGYIEVFYTHFVFYVITILVLAFIIFKISSFQIKNKLMFFIFSFLISGFLFYFVLLYSGNAPSHENYDLYIFHFDLIMQMKMLFLMIILFELGIIYSDKLLFCISLVAIFVFNYNYNLVKITDELFYFNKYAKKFRFIEYVDALKGKYIKKIYKDRYLLDRIYAYFNYKNIPYYIVKSNSYESSAIFIYKHEDYISNMYKSDFKVQGFVQNTGELYDKYLENGGPIITEEEIWEANFQKILDKEFIIYGN